MAHSEISQDKANLISTLSRYDTNPEGNEVLNDLVKRDFNCNSLYLNIFVDFICRIFQDDNDKREELKQRLRINQLDPEFNADILADIRLAAVSHLSKCFKQFIKFQEFRPNLIAENRLNSIIENCENELEKYGYRYRKEFEEFSEIGRGGFGTVFKAFNKIDLNYYAVKKIIVLYKKDSDITKVLREVRRFATLSHPNIVSYNQAWFENPSPEEKEKYRSNSKASSFFSYSHSKINSESTISSVKIDAIASSTNSDDSIIFAENITTGGFSNYSVDSLKKTCSSSELSISSQNQDSSGSNTVVSILNSSTDLSINQSNRRKSNWVKILLTLYIQMECCDHDLREYLNHREEGLPLPFKLTEIQIFQDIVNGLDHIHSKSIIHRDLKPNNVFYSSKSNCMKIGDFGLATLGTSICDRKESTTVLNAEHESHTAECGTPPYAAPEQRKHNIYDYKVDMYSLGVILFELLFHVKTRTEFCIGLYKILDGKVPDELKQSYPDYVHLILRLLSNNPKDRPSTKILLSERSTLEIENLKKMITEKDAAIARQDAMIAEQNEEIAKQNEKIAKQNVEIAKLTKHIKQLQAMNAHHPVKSKKSKRK